MPPGDCERYGTRYSILEDCRYPSYLSIRTQFSSPNESALIAERTINPAQHQHFWELSHSTTVILYKNDRSFWRYATLRRNPTSALFPVIRQGRLPQQSYP